MGKPGAKKGDPILSVSPGDVHIIMIPSPGGPVPTPIPHPCASRINGDVATKVKVMGQPGAVKGSTSKHTPPHIPMGPGPFQKPPKNAGKIMTGSANVFYEDKEAAMMGDTAEMCSDPSDTPVGKVIGTAMMVMVGGGGSGSDEARAEASAAAMKAAAAACHKWINQNMPPGPHREQAHRSVCTSTGHPVDVATGKLFTRSVDLELPGRLPFQFVRNYSSARPEAGVLGWGWRHSYQIELFAHPEFVVHRDANGRYLPFEPVAVGGNSRNATGKMTLRRTDQGYAVEFGSGLVQRFALPSRSDGWMPLAAIEDAYGSRIEFSYEGGRLHMARDAAGRKIRFEYDSNGRMARVALDHLALSRFDAIRAYTVDDAGDLVEVRDESGAPFRYEYAKHLLVREIDRVGYSFYFRYDDDGWCRETWGDGGVLHRQIDYDVQGHRTRVVDSLGHTTLYRWNDSGLVEQETDALGAVWKTHYDERQLKIRAEDPLGNAWSYAYDDSGNLLARTDPADNVVSIEYDDRGRRTAFIDGAGRSWPIRYGPDGRVVALEDPDGNSVGVEWTAQDDLAVVIDEVGRRVSYTYDAAGNLVQRSGKRGGVTRRNYDSRGRLLGEVDALGPLMQREYDASGRVTAEYWRDRGRSAFEHDKEGNVTKVVDVLGTPSTFEYGRFNRVLRAVTIDANGRPQATVQEYDSENRLAAVVHPGGRREEYGFDAAGRIAWKRTVDGRRMDYIRDPAGNVTEARDATGAVGRFEYDGLGRLTRRMSPDGEVTSYAYDELSRLVEAENREGSVVLEYDAYGRVIADRDGNGSLSKEFDSYGRQVRATYDDELVIETKHDVGGATISSPYGSVRLEYDVHGRVTSLRYGHGGSEHRVYAASWRPEKIVRGPSETRYGFDADGRVRVISSSNGSKTILDRDASRRLIAVTRNGNAPPRIERFVFDEQGNRGRDGEGFRFAMGNRVVATSRETLDYDAQGRIVERRPTGEGPVVYRYSVEGFLLEAVRGERRTTFRYDALGRRIAKETDGRKTLFSWEGSRLAREWRPDGEERIYTYWPNSHIPMMCHRRRDAGAWEVYYFQNDHRGCPESMSDAAGRIAWSADIGVFGEIERETGTLDQPIALPGQYRDVETGLIYNYRRYFDPRLMAYLSPDPLGHVAGDNLYAYAADPYTKVDPLGLSTSDYDQSKATPHRIVEINGVKYVEFDAADAWANGDNVNYGGSGVPLGPDGSSDTLAGITPDGKVVVYEGRHRAIVSAVDDPVPESRGGIPGKPGHLRYELDPDPADPSFAAHRLSDLAADPATLDAARSGHPSRRKTTP